MCGAVPHPALSEAAGRALLFVPASEPSKFERALGSGADGVILDLEDGVAHEAKGAARLQARAALAARPGERGPALLIRINPAHTPDGRADLEMVAEAGADGVVVPKLDTAQLELIDASPPLLGLVETARGLAQSFELAASGRLHSLLLGAADLAAELGLHLTDEGHELLYARSLLVHASAAAGLRPPWDCVSLTLDDPEAVRRQARRARDLGLRGKLCIHPAQVSAVADAFALSASQRERARRVVAAFEGALAEGRGAVEVDGAMVDAPVAAAARRILEIGEGR